MDKHLIRFVREVSCLFYFPVIKVDRDGRLYTLHVGAAISRTFPTCSRVTTGRGREYPARTSLVSPLHTDVVSCNARATFKIFSSEIKILAFHRADAPGASLLH